MGIVGRLGVGKDKNRILLEIAHYPDAGKDKLRFIVKIADCLGAKNDKIRTIVEIAGYRIKYYEGCQDWLS